MELAEKLHSENVFSKRIFDKDTGKSLICRYRAGEDPEQTFGLNWWAENWISYDEVMSQVVAALHTEQKNAIHVQEMLKSDDAVQEKATRMEALGAHARRIFGEMAEIEKPDMELYQLMDDGEITEAEYRERRAKIDEELMNKEPAFSEVMEKAAQLNKAFDRRNPWIKLYTGIEIPEVLSKEQARKWVGRLTVKDLTTVELAVPKEYAFWKEQLPAEWVEEI